MPQQTITIEQGQPVEIDGVTIELQKTGRHAQGTETAETAIVVVTTTE